MNRISNPSSFSRWSLLRFNSIKRFVNEIKRFVNEAVKKMPFREQ